MDEKIKIWRRGWRDGGEDRGMNERFEGCTFVGCLVRATPRVTRAVMSQAVCLCWFACLCECLFV